MKCNEYLDDEFSDENSLGIDIDQVAIHWETAMAFPMRVTNYLAEKGWEIRC